MCAQYFELSFDHQLSNNALSMTLKDNDNHSEEVSYVQKEITVWSNDVCYTKLQGVFSNNLNLTVATYLPLVIVLNCLNKDLKKLMDPFYTFCFATIYQFLD